MPNACVASVCVVFAPAVTPASAAAGRRRRHVSASEPGGPGTRIRMVMRHMSCRSRWRFGKPVILFFSAHHGPCGNDSDPMTLFMLLERIVTGAVPAVHISGSCATVTLRVRVRIRRVRDGRRFHSNHHQCSHASRRRAGRKREGPPPIQRPREIHPSHHDWLATRNEAALFLLLPISW